MPLEFPQQQQQQLQVAKEQRQELCLNRPALAEKWIELLRAFAESGLPEPSKIAEGSHGELSLEFRAAQKGRMLPSEAFIVSGDAERYRVLHWIFPPEEIEPGWVLLYEGAIEELSKKIAEALGKPPEWMQSPRICGSAD
jgi:hypothetical protein